MIKLKNISFPLISLFLFAACAKEEEYNQSGARVSFKLELDGRDYNLASPYSFAEFTSGRLSGNDNNNREQVGIAGLLIFNAGYDDNGLIDLKAFDLSCRYENNAIAKVKANNDREAICSTCGSKYDLLDRGRCVEGRALDKYLWQYRIERQPNNVFRVYN